MQFLAILTAVLGFVSLAAGRRAEVFYDGWMSESPTAKPPQNTMGGTIWMDKYTSICSMPRAHWRTFKNDRNAVVWLNCRDGFFAFFGHQGLEYVVALAHQNRDYRLTIVTTPIPSGQLFLNRQVGATEIETTNPPEIRKARPATPWAAPFSVDAADLPQAEGTDATPAIPFDEGVDANPALPVGAAPPPAGVGARVAQPFQG